MLFESPPDEIQAMAPVISMKKKTMLPPARKRLTRSVRRRWKKVSPGSDPCKIDCRPGPKTGLLIGAAKTSFIARITTVLQVRSA